MPMGQRILLPDAEEVVLDSLRTAGRDSLCMVLRAASTSGACPRCSHSSYRVHSRYRRMIADLPWEGIPVRIELRARRFFCDSTDCDQRIFTERLPQTVARYGRRTCRLGEALGRIVMALGGAAGSRLAEQLGILASGSTLLRQIRRTNRCNTKRSPRVLGIDDWAWRKGHRYGTILCDLEAGRVVDLLPDREANTVVQWLNVHPGTEIVSRDRASAYAEAARRAAPQAVQVADRWHLLHNLSEALKYALEPHHRLLAQAATEISECKEPMPAADTSIPVVTRSAVSQQHSWERRHRLYEQVVELVKRGMNRRQIAAQLGMGRRTVRRWLHAKGFPERKPIHRSNSVDAYADFLDQRWQQGCHNATELWRELREQGFSGQSGIVRNWLRQRHGRRSERSQCVAKPPRIKSSPRHIAWLILSEPESAKPYLEQVYRDSPLIAATASAAREFERIVRKRDSAAWPGWLQSARTTALANFASHLLRDQDAVLAALETPWSNGPVEGQVHRLKLIKRQMYGRASFDLLRIRVLNPA
jgi:transposase